MNGSILPAALAILLTSAPAMADSPYTSRPLLTALVKAQIALEEGKEPAVEAAMREAYLVARVAAAAGVGKGALNAVTVARAKVDHSIGHIRSLMGPGGVCAVRTGFDAAVCTEQANKVLADLGASVTVSVLMSDSQEKVTNTLSKAFRDGIVKPIEAAIAVANAEGL